MEWPSGIVTFLFTDLVGSSSRWDSASTEMESAVMVHDEILSSAISDHDGQVVKKTGDGFLVAFSDPVDAVNAAVQAQVSLNATAWDAALDDIEVRMGSIPGREHPSMTTIWDRR